MDPRSGTSDLWIHDVSRNAPTRLTSDLGGEADPIWSPDGRLVVFRSDRDGPPDLYRKSSSGIAPAEVLLKRAGVQRPTDWSSDGRFLTYTEEDRETGHSLWILPLARDHPPKPFLRTRFQEGTATFSPDGRWLAFVSDESGAPEVYVASVADTGPNHRISTAGGFAPRWRRDGKELFYVESGNRFMAVPVTLGANFEARVPVHLFRVASHVGFTRRVWYASYDVSGDGEKLLVNVVVARGRADYRGSQLDGGAEEELMHALALTAALLSMREAGLTRSSNARRSVHARAGVVVPRGTD
jgi:Tol biopolymer transport system component